MSKLLKMPSSNRSKRNNKDERRPVQVKKLRLDDCTSQIQWRIQQRFAADHEDRKQYSDTFDYRPLGPMDIRVLIIEPGMGDEPIRCRLVPSKMIKNLFTALSYFWGEGEPIHEVHLTSHEAEGGTNRGIIHVRSNLFVALKRFRDCKDERTMWIDALCINQKDTEERSGQIKKMHELYLHANNVCIWLGDGTGEDAPDPKDCFEFLDKMLNLKNLESLFSEDSKIGDNAVNIVSLMRNKWFSRRWVLQELALARDAEVVYGESKMPWTDFADAIAIFIKNQDKIRPLLSKRYENNATYCGEVAAVDGVKNLGANALVDFTNNLFRRSECGDIQQRMMTLEVLVSSLLAFEAADPRDTIYAVLSLAKDTYNLGNEGYLNFDEKLSPDYKRKRLLDVYGDFIDYCISQSQSLDILLRHWAPTWEEGKCDNLFSQSAIPLSPGEIRDEQEKLPSWIPLIEKSPYGTPAQRIRGRRSNGDSFVGESHRTGHRNYSATLDLKPCYDFGFKKQNTRSRTNLNRVFDGSLSIKGLRIGTIEKLVSRAAFAIIFREAFEIAGFDLKLWKSKKEWAQDVPRVPEGFWRTIVADRGPDGSNPPSWYSRAFTDCLGHLDHTGDLNPDAVIGLPRASRITKDFMERVKDVTLGRSFAQVRLGGQDRNTYGLVPAETEKEDLICVLFGASVPVVLREQKNGAKRQFIMVGECFIYGMMEGEAVSGESRESKAEKFELV
ncbi:heterokaryon incompatibility protein-domain-containing protein [Jackrogersella minutella]|nr:heterokaryon incompatibility protein-domain-containing protein [Jackrogersella minutella]